MMNKINKSGKKTVSKIMLMATILGALTLPINAQPPRNVGIGTENPNPSALLDLDVSTLSKNMGLLIPRVALTGTTDITTIPTITTIPISALSLLVYNTATVSDVVPGFYYWDGVNKWIRLVTTSNPGAVPFSYIQSDTNKTAQMTVGTGASLLLAGTGIVEASRIKGDGSATDAVDLATNETAGVLPIAKGGTGLGTVPANNQILIGNSDGTAYDAVTLAAGSNILLTKISDSLKIATTGLQSALTFSSPLSNSGGIISIPQANTGNDGYLSKDDWKAFYDKLGVPTGGNVNQYLSGDNTWKPLKDSVRTAISGTAPITYDNVSGAIGVTLGIGANQVAEGNHTHSNYLLNSNPAYTQGQILYVNGSQTLTALDAGAGGQFLKINGTSGIPEWGVDNNTTYTAGTGLLLSAANEFSARNDTAMWNAKKIVGKNIVDTLQPTAGQTIVWNETNNQWEYGNTLTGAGAKNGIAFFETSGTLKSENLLQFNGSKLAIGLSSSLPDGPDGMKLEVRGGDILARKNVRILPVETSEIPGELRFYQPGVSLEAPNYIAIAAPVTFAPFKYTLPVDAPMTGQILQSTNSGLLSWVSNAIVGNGTEGQTLRYNSTTSKWEASNALLNDGTNLTISNTTELRFLEASANGSDSVGFKAPANIANGLGMIYTLPAVIPTDNQILSSTATGVLSWIDAPTGGTGSLTNGTANGQTIRWNATTSVWEKSSGIIISDASKVGIGIAPTATEALSVAGNVNISSGNLNITTGNLAINIGSISVAAPVVESGATINVAGKTYIKVSTNALVSLQPGVDGQIIILQKSDAATVPVTIFDQLTVTGMKITGSWAPADYDTITLIFDGSNWVEIARSNNSLP